MPYLRQRRGCASEGHAMKMNGMGMRIGAAVLALGVSVLVIPASLEAQRAAGISRVGWLEVCGPGPRRPHFDIFRARLAEHGYVEGKNLVLEQRFEQIADTTGCRAWPPSSRRFRSTCCSPWARGRRESSPEP